MILQRERVQRCLREVFHGDRRLELRFLIRRFWKKWLERKLEEKRRILFVFEFELKLETFYFYCTFTLVFKDGLVWFSVFWWSSVPSVVVAVVVCFVGTKRGKIASDIAICATVKSQ